MWIKIILAYLTIKVQIFFNRGTVSSENQIRAKAKMFHPWIIALSFLVSYVSSPFDLVFFSFVKIVEIRFQLIVLNRTQRALCWKLPSALMIAALLRMWSMKQLLKNVLRNWWNQRTQLEMRKKFIRFEDIVCFSCYYDLTKIFQ